MIDFEITFEAQEQKAIVFKNNRLLFSILFPYRFVI